MNIFARALMIPLALALAAGVTPAQETKARRDAAEFVTKAAGDGQAEVALGQMAVDHAGSQDVRRFAELMIADHAKANKDLIDLADTLKVTIPKGLPREHVDAHDQLRKLRGGEFDRSYMAKMVADHRDALTDFENQAKYGPNESVRKFAARMTPVIKEHLKLAQNIWAKINVKLERD
jgi:putative membrane protein